MIAIFLLRPPIWLGTFTVWFLFQHVHEIDDLNFVVFSSVLSGTWVITAETSSGALENHLDSASELLAEHNLYTNLNTN